MARLSLALLGPMQVTLGGQPAGGFTYTKARALLAYLAVEAGRPHHRDTLAALLWPEMPDEAARHNLRQALANLRTAIGDATATPPFLLITRDTIQFNPASDYDLDVSSFTTLLVACETHSHRHLKRCRSCAARMEQAIALYQGGFLAEFALGDSAPFEEWQLRQRERLHQRALGVLAGLTDYHERRGEDERARHYATRQIELEPWHEEAYRQLMRLLARAGQRSAALAQYEACRRVLMRDLGVEPEPGTTALYEEVRDKQTSGPADEQRSAPAVVQSRSLPSQPLVAAALRHNFPAETSPLIGRESEIAELGALLEHPGCRLITVVGPGGIGKTRLALAAAAEQAEVFTDGAIFAPLAALSSAAFLAPTLLSALDVELQGYRDPRDQLLEYLREKELLLVLDNFEQLLVHDLPHNLAESRPEQGAAELLADVLRHAPGVTLLVTSRERLALPGEWLFDLTGLNYPMDELVPGLETYDAVQLFLRRAGQVQRQFALSGEAQAVARICRLVEGLPLAIELAAAALRTRSCAAIASAIERSIMGLASGLRAVPERQRSMWATFEHSWRLLSDEEQQAFSRLSVFRGGFLEEATANIAQASPQLLAALVDKSLLRWDGVARYEMHELMRQYAGEKLEQAGETTDTRRRHAAYFLGLAQATEPKLRGPEQAIWLVRLEAEHDNLRAALRWAIDNQEIETGLRLAGALGWFWYCHDHFSEGRGWLAELLAFPASRGVTATIRVKALNVAAALELRRYDDAPAAALIAASLTLAQEIGDRMGLAWSLHMHALMANNRGDYAQAVARSEQSLSLYRELGDRWGTAASLLNLGTVMQRQGRYAEAMIHYNESLAVFQAAGDKRGMAFALREQGILAEHQGEHTRASALFGESLRLFRELGEISAIAWTGFLLGRMAQQGDYGQAAVLLEECLALFQKLGDKENTALTLIALGNIAFEQGDYRRTIVLAGQGLRLCREIDNKGGIALGLEGLAAVAAVQSQPERAVRLFGATTLLREAIGATMSTEECAASERNLATAHAQLNEATFAAAWAEGRAMTLEEIIAYALGQNTVETERLTAAGSRNS